MDNPAPKSVPSPHARPYAGLRPPLGVIVGVTLIFRRLSPSISLNIAEGNGRWHTKSRVNFFGIARGSVFECVPLLELCRREKLLTEEDCTSLKGELEAMAKMLSALLKGAERRKE